MEDKIFQQLSELARALNNIAVKPIICGGLGIYLCFHKSEGEASRMIRATKDIDLILTEQDILEQSKSRAIADVITKKLEYTVREDSKYFRFEKASEQQLDILTPLVPALKQKGNRTRIVKSVLHGRIMEEACYIEEDLRVITISDLLADSKKGNAFEIWVPSPSNMLIMKLFAFDDRCSGSRQDEERAQAHALDVFIIVMLSDRDDYIEGQEFLSRHNDSQIIKRARLIVANKFSSIDKQGWLTVLEATGFFPNLNVQQKRRLLEQAGQRLLRWFNVPKKD